MTAPISSAASNFFAFADKTLTLELLTNAHDTDLDGAISPLTDGLILTTAAYAIEVASGVLPAPPSFNQMPSSIRRVPTAQEADQGTPHLEPLSLIRREQHQRHR